MSIFQILVTIAALILIFIFSINKFSRQIEMVAGSRFKLLLKKVTQSPLRGTILGAGTSSLLQSSTATTVMTVGLVNAGMLTFGESLGIILGANLGGIITSQLIALNITAVAPFIIILGFIILKFGGNYRLYGKPIFYFGLVFFCISLITQVAGPIMEHPALISVLSQFQNLPFAILVGILLTVIFQASSITISFILILAGAGVISFPQGVGLLLGANIGTTSTALLAAIPMQMEAKKTALAHLMFNVGGVIVAMPFLPAFFTLIESLGGTLAQQIANMHLFFNLFAAALFLIFIKQFSALIEWMARSRFLHVDEKKWQTPI